MFTLFFIKSCYRIYTPVHSMYTPLVYLVYRYHHLNSPQYLCYIHQYTDMGMTTVDTY